MDWGFLKRGLQGIKNFYEKNYKALTIIPLTLFILSLVQIGIQQATTGSFLLKDISLRGGTTLTVYHSKPINPSALEDALTDEFREEFRVRQLAEQGKVLGFIVDTSLKGEQVDLLLKSIQKVTGPLNEEDYSIDIIGEALGASFFREILVALVIAFLLMGAVVFIIFRTPVPSLAVIFSAFSDITVTLAIVNLLQLKVSTAGMAAFLMLIGYSVDTDILLTTHVLKRREGRLFERVYRAMATGFMTTGTTLAAVTIGLLLSNIPVITEIMTIVLIGLLIDLINTWVMNSGILLYYMERVKGEKP